MSDRAMCYQWGQWDSQRSSCSRGAKAGSRQPLLSPVGIFKVDISGPIVNLHQSAECLHVTTFQKGNLGVGVLIKKDIWVG